MATAPQLRDRLSFLHREPEASETRAWGGCAKFSGSEAFPNPSLPEISHESPGSSHCLLEYLLDRLHGGSGRVKLKVLKILLYLCTHGSPSFLLILKRNPALIQEAAAFTGPPDPLHGSSLYQKVRAAAQDLGSALFSDTPPPPPSQPSRALPAAGMGSQSRPQSALQGFGYSRSQGHTGSAGEAFLSTIQKAAEVVANAVRPGPGTRDTQGPLLQGDAYQAAVTPSASLGHPTPGNPPPGAVPGARAVRHQPGQAGGGWEEQESSPGSQSSSQNSRSKASDSGSRSGSDSPSGASRAPSDLAERVEAMTLSDCQQELSLVRSVTQGPRAFLSQEEAQHFIKECGLLNCEAVLELLIRHLGAPSACEQLRALGAIAALGCTDLLPQEHILLLARLRLQDLSAGSPGPVTHKATKWDDSDETTCEQASGLLQPLAGPALGSGLEEGRGERCAPMMPKEHGAPMMPKEHGVPMMPKEHGAPMMPKELGALTDFPFFHHSDPKAL
ncbi:hypothetical protein PAL_GLEAN10014556 [Pteropus alecto]|uniref:AP-4 complex accessory subunit Tepsin VHS/ENTH-like domain-containing protein n=1 Tax=Pteropus alecto TaxID=9402 RepID=L5KKT2_PTEAL|nr:hypothetical protein PAL_GLEAN10014556 [Pteropus alecto]